MNEKNNVDKIPLVRLYTKDECSLCVKAKSVLLSVSERFPFKLEEIDITINPEIYEKFKEQIPVVYIDKRKAFKYFIDEEKLVEKLKRCK